MDMDFDEPVYTKIDRLHAQAEELADLAKHTHDPDKARRLRASASRLLRQAARHRQQLEDD